MGRKQFTAAHLYRLRNEIDINRLIQYELDLEWKISDGYLRFLCPQCSEFNTATNRETNLARCFKCKVNFNPIDLVMAVKGMNFVEAANYLKDYLPDI